MPVTNVKVDNSSVLSSGIAQISTLSGRYSPTNKIVDDMSLKEQTGLGHDDYKWSSSSSYKIGQIVWETDANLPTPVRKMYRNITGTNRNLPPPFDTTNWEQVTFMNLTSDSGWITITPTNATAGTGNYVPKYRKVGNTVKMTGYITVKNNNAMFNLPEGFRPNSRWTVCGTNDAKNINEIRITETGNVQLQSTNGSLSNGVPVFLDNVSFFVD